MVDFARGARRQRLRRDVPTARLLRDAQVNTIWEGTSNICALDLQRAIAKQQGHRAVLDHLASALDAASDGPTGHLAARARAMLAQVDAAIKALAEQPQSRRDQQARRLADLFGDAAAFAAMAVEADFEAARGDFRKTLIAELFAAAALLRPTR